MRVVVQRVSSASVTIDGSVVSSINRGLLILLGIEQQDITDDADWLAHKLSSMRIFSDKEDKMNLDIREIEGDFLVVSQFTLHALTKKGNRPSFIRAARPEMAIPLYDYFKTALAEQSGRNVYSGVFGAMMDVALVNDGPVTILIDTANKE
jgi:D-tyrosyl-tRNA(Tyr) deacylase